MSDSADFEKLVANIYKELSPNARIKHNDHIYEKDSKIKRQIDVSIRSQIAGHEILLIVEVKDHKRPLDIEVIDAFADKIRGVKANKGILISNSGFSSSAIEKATTLGIELCTVHEALSKKWNQEIEIPVLWIDLSPHISVNGQINLQKGDSVPTSLNQMIFSNDKGKTRIQLLETFIRLWNENLIAKEPHKKHSIRGLQENIEILTTEKEYRSVSSLQIDYFVSRKAYVKHFSAKDYRGIQNYITKDFQPVRLKVGPISLIRDKSWKEISDPDQMPCKCFILISTQKIIEMNSFDEKLFSAQFSLFEKL